MLMDIRTARITTHTGPRELAAVKKARTLGGPALVRRRRHGAYTLPSASDPAVGYIVTGTGPKLDGYRCTCPAGQHGRVCWHAASVHLRRLRENSWREWAQLQAKRKPAAAAGATRSATAFQEAA
jgi:hypothetical protein